MIRSNNGINFVGTNIELKKAFGEMDEKRINDFLRELGGEWISWKRNPPLASNMGGVKEQQIRSARRIILLSLMQLLSSKTSVVMPPPGTSQKEDMYCRKQQRRVQHLSDDFWTRWRKEVLGTFQTRQKWNQTKQNFEVGDIVLVRDDAAQKKLPMENTENVQ